MNTVFIALTFLGFFLTYNTSKRACLTKNTLFESWIQNNASIAKTLGLGLLLIPFIIAIYLYGFASGILIQCILLMTISSLIICLTPLRIFTYRYLLLLFIVLFVFDISIS